jgi:hypothetical protein
MTAFLRSFWLCLASFGFLSFACLHLIWAPLLSLQPMRPPFPINSRTFISLYGISGFADHYLARFGLFGFRERVQKSDVVLLGSSHVELGLSAWILSANLSQEAGHPVSVFNLGVPFGDSIPFAAECLTYNQIRNKPVIVDIYVPFGSTPSDFAKKVDQASPLSAYCIVTNIWLRAANDWILDPWLPRLTLGTGINDGISVTPSRMLQLFATRNWANGDFADGWAPQLGDAYNSSLRIVNNPWQKDDPMKWPHGKDLQFTPEMKSFLGHSGLRPIYTLLPYDGYLLDNKPDIATPFVPVSHDDLYYVDNHHLNGRSRNVATERLYQGMKDQGLVKPWLDPASP